MEFSRQEYWSGLPLPPPGNLPNPGIETGSPALQAHCRLGHRGARLLPRAVLTKSRGVQGLPSPPLRFCMWPTVRIYRGLEILNESVLLLEFGLCRHVLPYAQHMFTLTCTFTHTCAQNSALIPNTSYSLSLPDREARATSPLTNQAAHGSHRPGHRLLPPFQATLGPSAPRTEAASAHSSHPPLPRKQAFLEGLGFKAEGHSPPHSFLPWSMEENPFAAFNLKNEKETGV